MIKIYCDGGSRGNPGPAASAFAVYEGERLIYSESRFLGCATNNVAEYSALVMALEWVSKNVSSAVEIILDSELVKKQMTGEYRIKSSGLRELAERAKALEKASGGVVYSHTQRAGNQEADRLVNRELDKHFV